jgi:hypothetical protein
VFSVEPGTVSLGVGIAVLPTRHIRCCFSGSLGFTLCVCVSEPSQIYRCTFRFTSAIYSLRCDSGRTINL